MQEVSEAGGWGPECTPHQTDLIRSEWRQLVSWPPLWLFAALFFSLCCSCFSSSHLLSAYCRSPAPSLCPNLLLHPLSLFSKHYPHVWSFLRSFLSLLVVSSLLFFTTSSPFCLSSSTSSQWDLSEVGSAFSVWCFVFLCLPVAPWLCLFILASMSWQITFHDFPQGCVLDMTVHPSSQTKTSCDDFSLNWIYSTAFVRLTRLTQNSNIERKVDHKCVCVHLAMCSKNI